MRSSFVLFNSLLIFLSSRLIFPEVASESKLINCDSLRLPLFQVLLVPLVLAVRLEVQGSKGPLVSQAAQDKLDQKAPSG
jgi:hypothetical protein